MSQANIALTIISSDSFPVTFDAPTVIAALSRSWTARISADVPIYIKVGEPGVEATDGACYLNEFEGSIPLAVPKGHEISILGTDIGTVWVAEIKFSAT